MVGASFQALLMASAAVDVTLLTGETDGLAIDFTDTTYFASNTWDQDWNQSRTSSVDSLTSPHTFYTQSGTSPKVVKTSSTGLGWSPHNQILQSQDISTTWTNNNSTETTDTTVAPDGTTTGDTLTQATATTDCYITQSYTALANLEYCFSVYLKASGTATDWARVILTDGTDTASQYFDLTNGVAGSTSVSGWSVSNSGIESVGSGWYRCYVATVVDNTTVSARVELAEADNDSNVQAGDAIIVWGLQVNRGRVPTAYVATTTTAKYALPISYGEGLLPELSAQNLCKRSNVTTTSAQWTASACTLTGNFATAPDGSTSAGKIDEGSTTNYHIVSQNVTINLTASDAIFSVYLKYVDRPYVTAEFFYNSGSFPQLYVNVDIQNGAINASGAVNGATLSAATITSVGNGWYRVTVSGRTGQTGGHQFRVCATNSSTGSVPSFAGTNKIFYAWGAQFETGLVATSLIPTADIAPVTRAADNVNLATSALSFYSATEGTVYFDGTACSNFTAANRFGWQLDDGTANEKIRFYVDTSANPTASIIDGGAEQIGPLDAGTATVSARSQMTTAWKANLVAASFNGAASVDDTTVTLPTVTTFRLGADINATHWHAMIRRFVYVPRQIEEDADTVEAWRYNF